ncbi:MAG: type IX secretion system outer membrane channel protein PorV [Chitinophagales bacterium]|nr:type IX secretion system outer membrane channel protein PorV [Chitinophagales bacterium]MDW8427017.1 type IX secretion system outer membrane channel protein PorV [Chitinophagales bacterium]
MDKLRMQIVLIVLVLAFGSSSKAQSIADSLDGRVNVINTAVPFLRIAPDARAGSMGDAGLTMSADANAIFWNTAKLPFLQIKDAADPDDPAVSAAVTYTPWLRELVNDIYLASLGVGYKLDGLQGVGFGLRYFSLGSITFTDASGNTLGDFNPHEFCIDVGYGRKISEHFSTGLNLGYVYSNLAQGFSVNNVPIKAGQAVKADISFFFNHPMKLGNTRGDYSLAATIANIGNKITYTESAENKDFLPTNLGVGAGTRFRFDAYNRLGLALDFNKLLVPTPDSLGTYRNKSIAEGIFGSFSDAEGGVQEELNEITISAGMEYWYKEIFSVRGGYFYEHDTKGARKFITAGLGIKYNVFGLNFSYLVPTSSQNSPLDNTLRFTLYFDFDTFGKRVTEVEEEE